METIIQLCKHVVAKVTLVPCSVKLTGKRTKVGHGEVTINNARIINTGNLFYVQVTLAEEFKFDHDLSFLVEYENCYKPQALVERGNPEASE